MVLTLWQQRQLKEMNLLVLYWTPQPQCERALRRKIQLVLIYISSFSEHSAVYGLYRTYATPLRCLYMLIIRGAAEPHNS